MNSLQHILRFLVTAVALASLCASLVLQAFSLSLVIYDILLDGRAGFGSFLGYGAVQVFALPAFLLGATLTYGSSKTYWMRWVYLLYFGSHLLVWLLAFLFPGSFGA